MIPLVRLYIRSCIFSSGFTVKILYGFIRAFLLPDPSHPADLMNLNLLEVTNYDTHHYAL